MAEETNRTPTETLRAAAARLRQVAGAATPGPWQYVIEAPCGTVIEYAYVEAGDDLVADCGAADDAETTADARYIATMHPGVAVALARWLDAEAVWGAKGYALNVARAVLGET